MNKVLSGRGALVTGGTRGIGNAIASRLRHDGAEVSITGTRSDFSAPRGFEYFAVDFADRSSLERFVNIVEQREFDILVNNAGINKIGPFADIAAEDFDRIQAVNIGSAFRLCQAVLPGMRKKKWGRIVNVSSIFGKIAKEFRGSYAASKFAMDGMTVALAAEVAGEGILANCVAPGFVDTELTRRILGSQGIEELVNRIPIRRLATPEEIAAFVAWLASPENTYITGQNIAIDGGFTRV
jgi:3-oxoacyl-[acyl-carrier protein] reductase